MILCFGNKATTTISTVLLYNTNIINNKNSPCKSTTTATTKQMTTNEIKVLCGCV